MDSGASLSEFSPLVDVLENAPVGGGVLGGVSGLGKDGENSGEISNGAFRESRKNTHLANDKDEDEDGEDEVFNPEKENIIESQEKRTERKRTISGTGGRSIKFPCGVCGLGVGLRESCVVHAVYGSTMVRPGNVLDWRVRMILMQIHLDAQSV